ncbi:hypothetical protein L873DRAFT_980767 [Choiromyces venosus 120613-1]|uniref:Uncharacterized protein n=1 Tax=Choiromyces venosus 120613-1 TaxID=1336337 RepID=A0A3N4JP68_9PEZI|nr:hypothetical protein L873DRAFT_980767 [Choiromyces venosus 120613-1]
MPNPCTSSEQWDAGREEAFRKVFVFFDNASSEERRKFEDPTGGGFEEQREWLRIASA